MDGYELKFYVNFALFCGNAIKISAHGNRGMDGNNTGEIYRITVLKKYLFLFLPINQRINN